MSAVEAAVGVDGGAARQTWPFETRTTTVDRLVSSVFNIQTPHNSLVGRCDTMLSFVLKVSFD